MPEGSIYLSSFGDQLGTMKFELANISASGGPEFPVLRIVASISLRPWNEYTQQGIQPRPISLLRAMGQLHSPEDRVVARFDEDIVLNALDPKSTSTTQMVFEIPLNILVIERIEEARSGRDLRVALSFKLLLALHDTNGSVTFHAGRINGLNFTIPRSQWVDHLLPGLGYGGLEVLEVRYRDGLGADALPAAVSEIRHGRKALLEGRFEQSALYSRKALETILDARPLPLPAGTKFRQKVDTFISDNLQVDDREAKLLAGQMQLIWEVTSPLAHTAAPHTFNRAEAEFVLRATMAIVEYFSRLLVK